MKIFIVFWLVKTVEEWFMRVLKQQVKKPDYKKGFCFNSVKILQRLSVVLSWSFIIWPQSQYYLNVSNILHLLLNLRKFSHVILLFLVWNRFYKICHVNKLTTLHPVHWIWLFKIYVRTNRVFGIMIDSVL